MNLFLTVCMAARGMETMAELKENTVQQTLCMPLWGRAIAAEHYPELFPDHDAGRIAKEMGVFFLQWFLQSVDVKSNDTVMLNRIEA